MKCYFLLVFLYSVTCDGAATHEDQKKCENTIPTKIQDCSNVFDFKNIRCCYIEATKSGNPIKGCKLIEESYYENNEYLNGYAKSDKRWDDISFVKCDPYSKTDSRSDSKYLKLGILSLLFLI